METGRPRGRRRLRGRFSGKTGKAVGITSVAAPLLGLVVNDLKKPDSMIRTFIGGATRKLLEKRTNKVKAIDITDKVEVVVSDTERNQ
jgi:hypothetical protein